ncbi:MAG TPA: LysE family translocator [Burkholderiaceae bacterium]|nr:LysE family translocator [Burkholderiaceae bacterium]
MFGTQNLGLFLVAALVLNATPGVDLLLTLSRTLQGGSRAGFAAALGIISGCVIHTLAAALGLAALLAASAFAFAVIKWIGAAYLLWLALGMLKAALVATPDARPVAAPAVSVPAAWRAIYFQGFLTNVLNPKVALFFLALLPQFIAADAPSKPLAFLFLGALFIVNGALFLFAIVLAADFARRVAAGSAVRRVLNGGGGLLFALLAARLALADRAP